MGNRCELFPPITRNANAIYRGTEVLGPIVSGLVPGLPLLFFRAYCASPKHNRRRKGLDHDTRTNTQL